MLIKIHSWMQQPKVWRFLCFVSSVIGQICYALSSSFNDLFGKWTWWKILLYIAFSVIIMCLVAVLTAKAMKHATAVRMKSHTAFLVLFTTSVYSFYFDKQVKGKPDAFSLVSSAAFAVMSLGLSRLSHFGFEVDLLYFFCGVLTVQLMKIKLWLVIVGGSFSYSLVILRSSMDALPKTVYPGLQAVDQVDIESGSHLLETNGGASQMDSSHTANGHLMTIMMARQADAMFFKFHCDKSQF